jgi:hypothetical protein
MSRSLTIADLSSPQEATFVAALFDLGGPQYAPQAAIRAGYADTAEAAERAAAFLLGSSRISRVITGEIKARFDLAAAAAYNTLLEICGDRRAPANARISAAQEILNRSSIGPIVSRSAVLKAETGIETLLDALDKREREAAAKSAQGGNTVSKIIDVEPAVSYDDANDEDDV